MNTIIFFLLGLIVGSFINVLVCRLRLAEDIFFDRSRCPHCKNIIAWYDNIPVISIILLNFKCRNCRKKISWQYPLVEVLTGVLFALIGLGFFSSQDAFSWTFTLYLLGASVFLMAILVYDWLYMEIPDVLLWPGIFWALVFNLFFDWNQKNFSGEILSVSTYSGVLAAFLAFVFFFLLSVLSHEKWMGMGDAYLAIFLGLILGWPEILLALFFSFLTGSIYGIISIAAGRKKMKSQVPFAPFMIIGTYIALFWYESVMSWYWGLFS